jgi:hypothetical protein
MGEVSMYEPEDTCLILTTIPVICPTFLVKAASQVMNFKECLFVTVNA